MLKETMLDYKCDLQGSECLLFKSNLMNINKSLNDIT